MDRSKMAFTRRVSADFETFFVSDSRTTFRSWTAAKDASPALSRTIISANVRGNASLAWEVFRNFLFFPLVIRPLSWSNDSCEGGSLDLSSARGDPGGFFLSASDAELFFRFVENNLSNNFGLS
jgi:hypothetical protein